jgi:hypothetical protein
MPGYRRDEFLRPRLEDTEARATPEEFAAHIDKVMRTRGDKFSTLLWHKDDRIIDLRANALYIPDPGGDKHRFLRRLPV